MMIRNKSVVITSGFTDSYVPIEKALQRIGGIGGGVTQVAELPATGDEGKIYYNTTNKKYYTYTSEEGFSEIGNNNAIKQYVFPYQKTPCFFDSRIAIGPSDLDAFVEYDEENDLFLVKNGTELTVDENYTFNDAAEDLSRYYAGLKSSMFQVISIIIREFLNNNNGGAEYNFSEDINVLDLYSRDLASHGAPHNWSCGSSWEFIIYTMRVVVNAKRINNFTMNASFTVLNKKVGSVGEYIIPQLNIVYNAIRKSGDPNELTVGYKTTIRHIGTMLGKYINSSYADITSGATHFIDYNNGINSLEIIDDMSTTGNPFLRDFWSAFYDIPLFRYLHISGRFYASNDGLSIYLPFALAPAQSNPSIEFHHTYEFSIYDGIFNLIDVTPNFDDPGQQGD